VAQLSAAAKRAQHSLPASSSASHGTCADHEAWQAEKRVLKSICKLALAVTMDQVGGAAGSFLVRAASHCLKLFFTE
jgi:hypothetical protein